jgi:alpha-glucuronidase
MKTTTVKLFILSLLILLLDITTGFSQQNKVTIQIGLPDKQLSFAGEEIKKAAENKGFVVTLSKKSDAKSEDGIIVKIISDSALVAKIASLDALKMPKQFGWQTYSIRVKKIGSQTIIYALAGDKTGAMYGGLDIAEAIRLGTIDSLSDSDNKPYLERRGI